MVRECRLTTARTIPQPIRVYRYQPDPSGKTVDPRHGNPPAERRATETKAMPYHRFYAQVHFFLTENVLGSRVEGCPCIPWPHLTVGKAIGIDISLSIHRDPPLLLLLLHQTIKSHITKSLHFHTHSQIQQKTPKPSPPFPPYPD